jgi:hypothetical protein
MKLLKEFVDIKDLSIINEDVDVNGTKEKVIRLKGPFLEANQKNKNGRTYPRSVLEREVKRYNEEKIAKNRAVGTLDHEDTPQINLERISHKIESLVMEGDLGIGVAKLIDTPMGRIAKTIVSEGIILGISTRGVGSLEESGTVKDDFLLVCADLVADPSCSKALLDSVLENKEYIMDGDQIVEVAVRNLQKSVDKKYDPSSMSNYALRYMMKFLEDINKKTI